jgi:hypothetical protein
LCLHLPSNQKLDDFSTLNAGVPDLANILEYATVQTN